MEQARFYDGQQGQPVTIGVEADNNYLRLLNPDTRVPLKDWPAESLYIISTPGGGLQGMLGCKLEPDCRLVLTPEVWTRVVTPLLKHHKSIETSKGFGFWLAVGLGVIGLCAAIIIYSPAALDELAKLVPRSWEDRIGSYSVEALTGGDTCKPNPVADAAMQRVLKQLDKRHGDFHVYVAEEEEVNALTAPGNNMVIYSALLTLVKNQGQFTAVLAHETGHAYYRHPLRSIVSALGARILLTLATGNSGFATDAANMAGQLAQMGANRDFEAEADAYGMQALMRNGVSPTYLGDFLKLMPDIKLEKEIPEWLLTHPNADHRLQLMKDELAKHPPHLPPGPPKQLFTDQEWQAIRHYCGDEKPASAK